MPYSSARIASTARLARRIVVIVLSPRGLGCVRLAREPARDGAPVLEVGGAEAAGQRPFPLAGYEKVGDGRPGGRQSAQAPRRGTPPPPQPVPATPAVDT